MTPWTIILNAHPTPGHCAECGKPDTVLITVWNRFTSSECSVCPRCARWLLDHTSLIDGE